MYDRQRKKLLGQYLHDFLRNSELWPQGLVEWCDRFSIRRVGHGGISIEILLKYMSDKTGIDLQESYYVGLLGNWSRWYSTPERGGDNAALILALADCEIVFLNGFVFTCPKDLVNWLLGKDIFN